MAQTQRSLRQIIAIRHSIARRTAAAKAGITPSAAASPVRTPITPQVQDKTASAPVLTRYTILTPIVSAKSCRSRKRVVNRVKQGTVTGTPSTDDIAMLFGHNAYGVIGTLDTAGTPPVRARGDVYVDEATGQVIAMGQVMRDVEEHGRVWFAGRSVCVATDFHVDPASLAARPTGTDLSRSRSNAMTAAVRESNLRFSRRCADTNGSRSGGPFPGPALLSCRTRQIRAAGTTRRSGRPPAAKDRSSMKGLIACWRQTPRRTTTMSLAITILTVTGTLSNGRERLTATTFHVSPVQSFSRDLAEMIGCEDALAELNQGEVHAVEIDPAGLLALEILPHLNMIGGGCFDNVGSHIDDIARAQAAARAPNVRVMIESGL